MPPFPAARLTDIHLCPAFNVIIPHLGGPVAPPCYPTVLVGGLAAARATDQATCVIGPPDFIVTGSATVQIGGKPAARMLDSAMHGGLIVWGCFRVLIGGPTSGATLGNPAAATAACQAAAAGRNPPPGATDPNGNQLQPNTAGQSYNNCGVESSRQIINQQRAAAGQPPLTQEALLNQSMANGDATQVPGNLFASGGTTPSSRVNILNNNGVPSHTESGSMANLEQGVAEGRGVVVGVEAGSLWPTTSPGAVGTPGTPGYIAPGTGHHAILVTGMEYDADGNLQNVIINDTGTGQCGIKVPAATFQQAMEDRGIDHVVTDNPVW